MSPRQAIFVKEYLLDLNATQACLRAGYAKNNPKNADKIGPSLLKDPRVAAAIQAGMDKRAAKIETKSDEVLAELARLGYSDIRGLFNDDGTLKDPKDWPDDLAKAVSSIEVQETFEWQGEEKVLTGYLKKVKMWNKPQSLELLGKNQKLFTDKLDVNLKVTLEDIVAGANEGKKK